MSYYYGSPAARATFFGFRKGPEPAPEGYIWCFSVGSYCRLYPQPEQYRDLVGSWGIEKWGWGKTYVHPEELSREDFKRLLTAYRQASTTEVAS